MMKLYFKKYTILTLAIIMVFTLLPVLSNAEEISIDPVNAIILQETETRSDPEVDIVASGTCGDNIFWTLDSNGLLTVSGTGDMDCSYMELHPAWNEYSMTTVNIKDGVTNIGKEAFKECRTLTSITIPSSVANIQSGAFQNCDSLADVNFAGTEEQWLKISIEEHNDGLDNAELHIAYIRPDNAYYDDSADPSEQMNDETLQEYISEQPASEADNGIEQNIDETLPADVLEQSDAAANNTKDLKTVEASEQSSFGTLLANTSKLPSAVDNTDQDLIKRSYLEPVGNGYMRVFYNGKKIQIEYLDAKFNIQKTKSLKLELPIWGGFYKGEDGSYYIVEGKNNSNCKDGTEVVRIIKYNSAWKRLGSGSIKAQEGWEYEIRYPFYYGCVNMTEANGNIYVITGRQGYVDAKYGKGHQGMMLIRMNETSFNTDIVYGDFWHSFAQYIESKGSDVYLYELSEGSRATYLSRYDANSTETDYFDAREDSFPVFRYGGTRDSAWSIPCYATVDDFALSGQNALGVGTSIDQKKYDSYSYGKTPYNIYLTVTPLSDLSENATKTIWLTSYKKEKGVVDVKITKINDNRFMVSWNEATDTLTPTDLNDSLSYNNLHYIFIDGSGNKIGKSFTAKAANSDCHPVLSGNNVVFYASDNLCVDFYTINSTSGKFHKTVHRTLGNNITWKIRKGTLTISGTGKIPSNTNISFLSNKVKKLVIKKGITGIGASSFTGFSKLKTIRIEDGIKSIGKLAFSQNMSLKKITIPASVKKIGKNILLTSTFSWTTGTTTSIKGTIYTPKGSYAAKYAKKKGIKCVTI